MHSTELLDERHCEPRALFCDHLDSSLSVKFKSMHDIVRDVLSIDDLKVFFKLVVELGHISGSSEVCVEEESIVVEHPVNASEEIINVSVAVGALHINDVVD